MRWIKEMLRAWLEVPSTTPQPRVDGTIRRLQDRMDSLEAQMMIEPPRISGSEADLAVFPDAHLGAQ